MDGGWQRNDRPAIFGVTSPAERGNVIRTHTWVYAFAFFPKDISPVRPEQRQFDSAVRCGDLNSEVSIRISVSGNFWPVFVGALNATDWGSMTGGRETHIHTAGNQLKASHREHSCNIRTGTDQIIIFELNFINFIIPMEWRLCHSAGELGVRPIQFDIKDNRSVCLNISWCYRGRKEKTQRDREETTGHVESSDRNKSTKKLILSLANE